MRGPAAGGAITFILLIWLICDYRTPGGYRPLWEFTSTEESAAFPELRVPTTAGEDVFKLRPGTRNEYRLDGRPTGRHLPGRPVAVIVVEGEKRSTFKPDRDAKGNFKVETSTRFGREASEPLRYIDENGRVMDEDTLGILTVRRPGRFVGNLLLNFAFLAACFLALWLLLLFQWPHALGQALVLWAVVFAFRLAADS